MAKIHINTNLEVIANSYDFEANDIEKDHCVVARVYAEKVANYFTYDLADDLYTLGIEVKTDNIFRNWNGGKHTQYAKESGQFWCCWEVFEPITNAEVGLLAEKYGVTIDDDIKEHPVSQIIEAIIDTKLEELSQPDL